MSTNGRPVDVDLHQDDEVDNENEYDYDDDGDAFKYFPYEKHILLKINMYMTFWFLSSSSRTQVTTVCS